MKRNAGSALIVVFNMKTDEGFAMRILDVHAHIYPPKIEAKAVNAIREFYDRPYMAHRGAADALLESGRNAGVTDYLVFSTATVPHQVKSINDFILGVTAEHPEFIGAGTIHVDYEDNLGEMERIYNAGLRGIKFHPDFQKFNIDDERLFPSFELLEDKGMFFITHSGDPRYPFSHPERVARVAKRFPKLKIIAAHFGGWMTWDIARRCLAQLPNVYIDTSSTYGFGGKEPMIEGFKAFDNTHIFFGCDYPMWDHKDELEVLYSLGFDDTTLKNVLYNNFARFYGLEEDK